MRSCRFQTNNLLKLYIHLNYQILVMAWKVTPGSDSSSLASLFISPFIGNFPIMTEGSLTKTWLFCALSSCQVQSICVGTKWLPALRRAWNLSSKCSFWCIFLMVQACETDPGTGWDILHRDMQTRKLTRTHVRRTTKDDPKLDHPVTSLAPFWGARTSELKRVSSPRFLGLCFRPSHISSHFLLLTSLSKSSSSASLPPGNILFLSEKNLPLIIPRFDINLK